MKAFVTGAAGFVGSTLVDALLEQGHVVVGFDNFSRNNGELLKLAQASPDFRLVKGDCTDPPEIIADCMRGCDVVFHFAANADVRSGLKHPRRDLEQNTMATLNMLEAMRMAKVEAIAFASTGSVYGPTTVVPTPEDAPFPIQTSLYSASKLAGESLITAFSEGYGIRAFIFRFVSMMGPRYSHGHVIDFVQRLSADPAKLHLLGDGTQRKSYIHVADSVEGILTAVYHAKDRINIFNVGVEDACTVVQSAGWIGERLGLSPTLTFAGGDRGWAGDNPIIVLDTSRLRALGWAPKFTIRQSIEATVDWVRGNP